MAFLEVTHFFAKIECSNNKLSYDQKVFENTSFPKKLGFLKNSLPESALWTPLNASPSQAYVSESLG